MGREEFEAMDLDDRMRTLDRAIYDMNAEEFAAKGITEDAYLSMSLAEQDDELKKLSVVNLNPQLYLQTEAGQKL